MTLREPSSTRAFYEMLPPLASFLEVTDLAKYHPVPADWSLIVTDVQGSTQAIESGRYKDVNAVGVASIVAVQNALPDVHLPFVFGGDGASVLVPNQDLDSVLPALRGARERAQSGFGLALRAGVVGVAELRSAGHELFLARLPVSDNAAFAMFAGDGMSVAERWIKHPERGELYAVPEAGPSEINLKGFECRWEPLPSRRGKVVSLLVHALGTPDIAHGTYRDVVTALEGVVQGAAPVSQQLLSLASDQSAFHQEASLRGGAPGSIGYHLRRFVASFENRVGRWLVARGAAFAGFDGAQYPVQVAENTDYRKFDDTLRMVLDVTTDELTTIERLLDEKQAKKELAYGIHASDAALMTCIVRKYEGAHVHFVDGADGGYALAAKKLKARLT